MIVFPTSPVVGQTYTFGNRTWEWTGTAWQRQINAGQSVAVFVMPGTNTTDTVEGLPYSGPPDWYELNYV